MKLSLDWLKEFIDPTWDAVTLGSRLTLAGFELESITTAAPPFKGVIVAEILSAVPHPQADKLRVCSVNAGAGATLQIVCGASNARAGLKTALATVGAVLPQDLTIKAAKLRGVDSAGMLCSARELGLAETSDGILELPAELTIGQDLRQALKLDDAVLEIAITPNRGDAMSVLGLAREVAVLAGQPLARNRAMGATPAVGAHRVPVRLVAGAGCPKFAGRVISGVDNRRLAPLWLRERLRRAGLRSISPVVDVTNFVLLELGQPMHAYDMAKLVGGITVRKAIGGESLTLLDGKARDLQSDMLIIADDAGAVALAGVMGGERTAVSDATTEVFLEVAWFAPSAIAGRARRLGLTTDASQRFERGVDPQLQELALERATALLIEIAGGSAGPIEVTQSGDALPMRAPVELRRRQLRRLLGVEIPDSEVERSLTALGFELAATAEGWRATPPSPRFDIALEADLIEEVARTVGLERVPVTPAQIAPRFAPLPEAEIAETRLLDLLAARGYQEAIHFAFVDPKLQQELFPDRPALHLSNPIAAELTAMRVSLWPGLLKAAGDNLRRQQDRVRLFELGAVFDASGAQVEKIAALSVGRRAEEQWGVVGDAAKASSDFHDMSADVAALCSASGLHDWQLQPAQVPCLHPGRSAAIVIAGETVGHVGELHPQLVLRLGLTYAPQLFELDRAAIRAVLPAISEISRQPQVRRDLAVVIDESVSFAALRERVTSVASGLLREVRCFDVYQGAGVESGRKSVALGLIFQDNLRTLTDEDADRLMAAIRTDLGASLNARIRE
jgi:phenylalanyl-tRNA synthetase beta chain